MKTFLEHLQDAVGGTFPLEDIINNLSADEIAEEAKLHALEACREALKNASDNAVLVNKFGDDIGSFTFDEFSNKIRINKQSILSETNIPKEVNDETIND